MKATTCIMSSIYVGHNPVKNKECSLVRGKKDKAADRGKKKRRKKRNTLLVQHWKPFKNNIQERQEGGDPVAPPGETMGTELKVSKICSGFFKSIF